MKIIKYTKMKSDKCHICKFSSTMQEAIANVIYAEGQEIKKIIEITNNMEDIITINNVINKNMYQMTLLENSIGDNLKLCYCLTQLEKKCSCHCIIIDGGTF